MARRANDVLKEHASFRPILEGQQARAAAAAVEPAAAPMAAGPVEPILTINAGAPGAALDIRAHLVPGLRTVFFFTSKRCSSCNSAERFVRDFTRSDTTVAFRRIDIDRPGADRIDFGSPVAQQYRLPQVPHFIVFDESGGQLAEGTPAVDLLNSWAEN